ncbi:MAG: hypothetical protein WCR97_02375 [Bacilli bacterium]
MNEIKNNSLFRLKRDLYTNSRKEDVKIIANVLYRLSYMSFYSALEYYDMIPEKYI